MGYSKFVLSLLVLMIFIFNTTPSVSFTQSENQHQSENQQDQQNLQNQSEKISPKETLSSFSEPVQKWVQGSEQEIFVHYTPPLDSQKPVLVLLNGLTCEHSDWSSFVQVLKPLGYGFLQYDPVGQGHSLNRYGAPHNPVNIETQAEDLYLVTQAFNLKKNLNLVGFSYGGALAIFFAKKYHTLVENAFLIAPYTEIFEEQDTWVQKQIQFTRLWQPWITESDDNLYSYFLRIHLFTLFPVFDKKILSHPEKRQSTYQLIEGIRKHNLKLASQYFPESSVHLVIAGYDEYIRPTLLEHFWNQLPEGSRSTKMILRLSEHKIPQNFPTSMASWIHQVLEKKDLLEEETKKKEPLTDSIINLQTQSFSYPIYHSHKNPDSDIQSSYWQTPENPSNPSRDQSHSD
jgi:pimeloyl-ACP methyl ester carboxylesterase